MSLRVLTGGPPCRGLHDSRGKGNARARSLPSRAGVFRGLQPFEALQIRHVLLGTACGSFHRDEIFQTGKEGRYAEQLARDPVFPDRTPRSTRDFRMNLHTQESAKGEDIAGNEVLRSALWLESSPNADRRVSSPRILQGWLDQDVNITGGPVGDVRQDRHPPNHDVGHAVTVECVQELGKVLAHRQSPG